MEKEKKGIRCSYAVLVIILFAALCFVVDYSVIDRKLNRCDYSDSSSTIDYSEYSNKVKSQRTLMSDQGVSIISGVENSLVGDYIVRLSKDGLLSIEYSNESDVRNISDNVLSYYLINTGQDIGKTLFFIKEDGTVSKASIEYGYSALSDIEIEDNVNGLKDIVTILEGSYSEGLSGSHGPIFIDINGNMYSK